MPELPVLEELEQPHAPTPEVQALIRRAVMVLATHGIAATSVIRPWNRNADGGVRRQRGIAGLADIVGVVPPTGRFLAIAVPNLDADGKPYRDQFSFLGTVNAMGGAGFFISSIDQLTLLVYHTKAGGKFEIDGDKLKLTGVPDATTDGEGSEIEAPQAITIG